MSTVLILADLEDEHALHVRDALAAHGSDHHLLDSRDFPQHILLSAHETGEGRIVTADGVDLSWSQITSIYWRQYSGVSQPALPHAEQAWIAGNDARSLMESMFLQLPARWVNGFDAYRLHQTKPAALQRVADMDLPPTLALPRTLWSNDPDAIRDFVAACGACIFKPVQGGAHTQRFDVEHLTDAHMANLVFAPVTVQQCIAGTDVRVFVAGEQVHACEIKTDHLDFRDDDDPAITPTTLPREVEAACVAIARKLHLQWTGIDLRRTEDGRYFYFESNPSPMFLGFESRSGLPLTQMLVELLVAE